MHCPKLTWNDFVTGSVFFHKKAPRIHLYLNDKRDSILLDYDKTELCTVTNITHTSFIGARWFIDKKIEDIYSLADFRVIPVPEESEQ